MCCVIDKQMEVNEQTSLLSSSSISTHKQKQELIDSSSTQSSTSESSSSSGSSSSSSTFFEIYHQYTNTSSDGTNGHDDDHHDHHHDQPPEDDATPSATTGSSSSSINYSSNILLGYRLQELKSVSQINLWLSIFCLIYLGINVCLICANYVNYQYEQTHKNDTDYDEEDEPVNDIVYHMTEFWATFCFAVIKYLAIVNTPKAIITSSSSSSSSSAGTQQQRSSGGKMISNPMFLRIVMFIDIVATITPAVMISFSVKTFEIPSHEIEYTNSLIMTFIDIIIAGSLWNNSSTFSSKSKSTISSKSSNKSKDNYNNNNNNNISTTTRTTDGKISMGIVTLVALVVAIIQLGVYNLMGYDEETGEMKGETVGHFLEFTSEIVSSTIAFLFCIDNKFIADQEISTILYGSPQLQLHDKTQQQQQQQLSTLV